MASTHGTQFDVTPEAIARRKMNRKIADIMYELVNNNITVYTDDAGYYNDNYVRTLAVLTKHLAS